MTYFAWANGSEPATFIGPTHPGTGKRSQQGSLSAFMWRSDRDRFIAQTKGAVVAVTAKEVRELKAGLDDRAFKELIAVLLGGIRNE
ncbi:hypothetical protein NM74_21625 [Aeromonas hydrophila]|uniref:hypothetical protein n=1 Tax=Aeromonas hydrophila TaxID=644 RepID=UPI000537CCF3|nr:hypothetical protein [Aeromonas hydrophila]KHA54538.1 hypothetical protein NM74_21625 [Aeromonas hydrophila]